MKVENVIGDKAYSSKENIDASKRNFKKQNILKKKQKNDIK